VSIANSAASFAWSEAVQDCVGDREVWIRPGLVLFGISPFSEKSGADMGLLPVMRFEARLIAVKALRKGESVGYKRAYKASSDSMLGVISAGYGDGYTRHFRSGTPVLINGRKVPVIGNVSMDMITVDLGPGATDSVGDIATLWGDDLPVEEVAPYADAIPYDLICGVMHREVSEVVD
jgi:alanine racemase